MQECQLDGPLALIFWKPYFLQPQQNAVKRGPSSLVTQRRLGTAEAGESESSSEARHYLLNEGAFVDQPVRCRENLMILVRGQLPRRQLKVARTIQPRFRATY